MLQVMSATIRGRIIAVFTIFLTCVAVLTIFDWWSIVTIRQKVLISEDFEDMFNHILEARRYEKNFFFYHDRESLNEAILYISKAIDISDKMTEDIERVVGKPSYRQFQQDLKSYKEMTEAYGSGQDTVVNEKKAENIRIKGKAIVDFSEKLLTLKRERIHRALTQILGLPFAFLAIFVLLSMLIARMFFINILNPLALIRQTIGKVAEGDFCPIPYHKTGKDEISQLIYAFNRMESELETKQEQLIQSRKIAAIGTFTAGIAHELNNPINNIYLTAETFLDDDNLSNPEGRELVSDILAQAERAGEIIRNLLDFSRSELPSFAELNIREVIEKTLKLVKNQTMLAGIRTDIAIADDLPKIRGNFRNMEQIFLNMFLNAIQAMPEGGAITINASRSSEEYLKIDIGDTGTGISSEHLEHIFEPFYTTKSVGRGTGLGLAVTYSLVKKHGGYIEVQSELNAGTTFSIYLPFCK